MGVGTIDGATRLQPLRRPGRRLGLGGDSLAMGVSKTEHCASIHTNMPLLNPRPEVMDNLTDFERKALTGAQHYWGWDSG